MDRIDRKGEDKAVRVEVSAPRTKPLLGRPARTTKTAIGVFLFLYSILTILPFYLLFIRTFVSTSDSTVLHLWIPKAPEFSMESSYGNMSIFYSMDSDDFKSALGIDGYISPNYTFSEISEKFGVDPEKIRRYMQPYRLFNGWIAVVKGRQFLNSLANTVTITGGSIILGTILSICTGSVLAGFRRRWHFLAYNIYMLQVVIPPVLVMIPQFLIVKSLHLDNSLFGIILFNIKGGALSVMLFTSFIAAIPRELAESVTIDGGSRLTYVSRIVFPLCRTPFASFAAIQVPLVWNDLLYPLLFLKPEKYTLTPWVNTFVGGEFATNFQAIYTGLFVSLLPLLFAYIVFRRFFVHGVMAGAVKG